MNIAMMAYTESGGAGRASVRLMDGLNRLSDVSCDMIVQETEFVRNAGEM